MKGYVDNIEQATLGNENFREVLFTGPKSQLVVMNILPGEEIGEEIHEGIDQFLRIESGKGKAILDGEESEVEDGTAVLVPAGTKHNVVNTGDEPLKLYTLYMPPEHKDGTIHKTKAEAMADEHDHYEG